MALVVSQFSSFEIKTVNQVGILDEGVCTEVSTNTLEFKYLSLSFGKTVEFSGFFKFVGATSSEGAETKSAILLYNDKRFIIKHD